MFYFMLVVSFVIHLVILGWEKEWLGISITAIIIAMIFVRQQLKYKSGSLLKIQNLPFFQQLID
jgi:hypothetical protein